MIMQIATRMKERRGERAISGVKENQRKIDKQKKEKNVTMYGEEEIEQQEEKKIK
jgi:hypothetical protein